PHGAPECGLHCRAAAHHGVRRGREEGEGESPADARRRRWHGRHVLGTSKTSKTRKIRTTPRESPGRLRYGHPSRLPAIPTAHLILCQDYIASGPRTAIWQGRNGNETTRARQT